MKKLLVVAAVSAIVLSGCVVTNQQGGTLVGAGLGGLLGSQFGSGTGQLAATGLGVLAGGLLGNQIGYHMDQPQQPQQQPQQTIVYNNAAPQSNNRYSHQMHEWVEVCKAWPYLRQDRWGNYYTLMHNECRIVKRTIW
jgi:surface antigen